MSEHNNIVMNNAEFSADNNETYSRIRSRFILPAVKMTVLNMAKGC